MLPHGHLAIIDQRNLTDYLLASGHPAGRAKATFFQRFGFATTAWTTLRDALLDHARSAPVASVADTPFGKKYVLDGPLTAPDGRRPQIRSVWFVEFGDTAPKFVTAYPAPGARR